MKMTGLLDEPRMDQGSLGRWVMFNLNGPGNSFIIDILARFQPGANEYSLRCIPETLTSSKEYRFISASENPLVLLRENFFILYNYVRGIINILVLLSVFNHIHN